MCKGKTCWNFDTEPDEALLNGLSRAQALVHDGLASIGPDNISFTPQGKRFLRNLCMTLDARLWADKPSTQLFSLAG